MVLFAIYPGITLMAFITTTSIGKLNPIKRLSYNLFSIPPTSHPSTPDDASRQHDEVESNTKNPSVIHRRSFFQNGSSMSLVLSSILGLNALSTPVSNAINIETNKLRPATEDQPQIPFPDINALKDMEAATTLEGLIYLTYPKSERPMSNDVIVLSVRTTLEPDLIVAGALVPVSRIPRFPFQFRINAKNAVSSSLSSSKTSPSTPEERWNYVMQNNDLLVRAVLCRRDTIGFDGGSKNRDIYQILDMCQAAVVSAETDDSQLRPMPLLSGEGIAKLIRYSGNDSTAPRELVPSSLLSKSRNSVIIRAPVSLPLG